MTPHCDTCRRPTPHPPGSWHPHRCGCHTCTVWARWVDLHRDERGEL